MKYNHVPAGVAAADNALFDRAVQKFLKTWYQQHANEILLRFDQPMDEYLAGDALRDLFLNRPDALLDLMQKPSIFRHLNRGTKRVHFDPVSGDPLLSATEQRIYNLTRRMADEAMHIPFRSVHPNKQTEAGDTADISTYPAGSEKIRYNSGNHFISRPANNNVFEENSKLITAKTAVHLQVYFQHGFLTDRLRDVIALTRARQLAGNTEQLLFVICSRHSLKEGHFGVALVIMNPANPLFPERIMICDTLLKELPQHPRWWPHFIEAFSSIFGPAVIEMIEDLSHPLQKVNITGDAPYNHDWDCPYYAAAMANALVDLAINEMPLLKNGSLMDIHIAMATLMPEYYYPNGCIKNRQEIRCANQLKRWKSGRELIKRLAAENRQKHKDTGMI